MSKTSSALTKTSSTSLFHHRPPTSLFPSLALSLSLWSPAALDSLSTLKSSLALLACQAADGTNGYLRSYAPLSPPTSSSLLLLLSQKLLLFLPNCSQLSILHSTFFFFYPSSSFPPLPPCCCLLAQPFPPPLLAALGTGGDCVQQNIVLF